MKEERHYRVQKPDQSCESCRHHDVIIEPYNNPAGNETYICTLDYEPVDKNGICDEVHK